MPIEFQADDRRRLIRVTASEPYASTDVMAAIERQWSEDKWDFAMLYDLRQAVDFVFRVSPALVSAHVRKISGGRKRGPVGLWIAGAATQFQVGFDYARLTKDFADVEVLATAQDVDEWLERNAPPL